MYKIPKPIFEVLVIFLFSLIPLLWFKQGFLAAGHDMSYPLAPIDFWLDRLFVWTDRIGSFGSNQTDAIPGVFIHGLQAFFYFVTGSLQLGQKLDFIFWFFLPGVTMYIMLRSLHPSKDEFITRISGALFYMLNHYLLQGWIIAEMSKFSTVSALPLVVLGIINVNLRGSSVIKTSILIGITLFFLNGGAGIPLWGGLTITALTAFTVTLLISPQGLLPKLRKALFFTVLSLFFVLLLNLYWIFPYISSYKYNYIHKLGAAGGSDGAISWSQEISKNASFTNLFKLQGIPDWYDNPNHPYSNTLLTNYFFLLLAIVFPAIAFVSLLNKKNQTYPNQTYKIIFLAILLVAIPFTAGSHPPTGVLYNLFLKYVPGFAIFRTPFYKFGMALWFAYAYLVAVGLKQLADLVKRYYLPKFPLRTVSFFILGLFIVLLSVYNFPAFTGSFFNWSNNYSTRVKVPDYIFEAKKELDDNSFSTRTLMLPQLNDGNKYISYDWKYFSLSSIPSMLSRRPVLLNDAVLSGNEPGLVNAIYNQLETSSWSSLLKFAGVDKAIVQEDFKADEDMDYLLSPTKDAIYIEPYSSLHKKVGNWIFFNINDPETKPLVYIPQSFSYILAETSHLSLLSQTPEFPPLADALVFKHISKENKLDPAIDQESIQNITIQSQCLNCEEKKQTDIIRSKPPRIPPSNPFYFLIEFIDQQKMEGYKQPAEKIDFILGTMSKEVSAMDTIIANSKNSNAIIHLLTKWGNNIKLIDQYFDKIGQQEKKEEYFRRVYFYYWNLSVSIQKWGEPELTKLIKTELYKFEDLLRRSVQELDLDPRVFVSDYNIGTKHYNVNIPHEGDYKIVVYDYKPNDERESFSGIVNAAAYSFTKSSSNSNKWYSGETIRLNKGESSIVLPELIRRELSYPGFKVSSSAGSSECKQVDLGKIDKEINYDINLDYLSFSDRLMKVELLETSKPFPKGKKKFIYPQVDKNPSNPFSYRAVSKYKPSAYAETAILRICIEGVYDFSTTTELKSVKVTEKYPDYLVFTVKENPPIFPSNYNLQFVALNQTAYLVRVSGNATPFVLGLNSRFDQQWGVREVETSATNSYFKGREKKYLGGKVVEYERQDKHLFSEMVFKGGLARSPDIELNAYGNGWLINNVDKNVTTYLIEYQAQSTLYRTSLVSIISLLSLGSIYSLFYVIKK